MHGLKITNNNSASNPQSPQAKIKEPGQKGLSIIDNFLGDKRIFVFVGLIIIILSLTIFRQTILKTVQLAKDNSNKRQKLTQLTQKAIYLEMMDKNQLETRVREIEQVFPSKKPALELLYSLRNLAGEDNVNLGEVTLFPGRQTAENPLDSESSTPRQTNPQATKTLAKGPVKDFSVNFNISGELGNVTKFINDLEETSPLVQIDNLSLTILNYEVAKTTVQVSLGTSVYYQEPPKEIPAVEAPLLTITKSEEELLGKLSSFKFYTLQTTPLINQGKEDIFSKGSL